MPNTQSSPLLLYIEKHSMSAAKFMEMARDRGWPIGRSQLSMLCTGYRRPGTATQSLVFLVTDGEVRPEDWAQWRRKKVKRRRPERRAFAS